jgi:hypothetical protein
MAANHLRVWSEPCIRSGNQDQDDHVAEATMLGTAIARFRLRHTPPRTLTVMPLRDRGRTR